MVIGVLERRTEIGVRRALGAHLELVTVFDDEDRPVPAHLVPNRA